MAHNFGQYYSAYEKGNSLDEGYWWDELSHLVYRASSSPRKEVATAGTGRNAPAASFDDFQESVNDAWDLGDDEFCVISGRSFQFSVFFIVSCFLQPILSF